MTFLRAPASSTPTTSSLEYTRKTRVARGRWTLSATAWSAEATTTAVGSPLATSMANEGPESTASGRPGTSAAATSVMRRSVSTSRPFVADTKTALFGTRPPASR